MRSPEPVRPVDRPLLMAAVCLASILPGCSGSDSPGATPPPLSHSVRIALPSGVVSRDLDDPSQEEFASSILSNVYERLVEVGDDLRIGPGLAESWHNPDLNTWVFTLRRDVRWHDGRLMDAQAVAASIRRSMSEKWMRTELEAVSEVTAQGTREVVFHTRETAVSLPARLTLLFIDGGPGPDGAAVGSGRYRIAEWRPSGYSKLEAFPSHRDGLPAARVVEFLPVRDGAERVRLLRSGQADLVIDAPPEDMSMLSAAGFQTISRLGLRVLFLGMDVARQTTPGVGPGLNPFRDRRVREAVSLGVDRQALVAGPLGGFGEPTVQLPVDGQLGFDRSLGVPRADPKAARERLASAGHGSGFEVDLDYMPGKYLKVDEVVSELKTQLSGVGLRVRPRPWPTGELVSRVEKSQSSFWLLGWLEDGASMDGAYTSLLRSPGPASGSMNGGGYSNPEVDRAIDASKVDADSAERGRLLRGVTRQVFSDWPIVPLYRQSDLYAFDSRLGFEPRPDRRLVLAKLGSREPEAR